MPWGFKSPLGRSLGDVAGDWKPSQDMHCGTRARCFHGAPGDRACVSTAEFAIYHFDETGRIEMSR